MVACRSRLPSRSRRPDCSSSSTSARGSIPCATRTSRATSASMTGWAMPYFDDEVLRTFAVVGDPEEVGPAVRARFDGLVDRFSVYASYPAPQDRWDPLVRRFP